MNVWHWYHYITFTLPFICLTRAGVEFRVEEDKAIFPVISKLESTDYSTCIHKCHLSLVISLSSLGFDFDWWTKPRPGGHFLRIRLTLGSRQYVIFLSE